MLIRLETMVLMGANLPLEAIRRQIASGVDILVHLGRMKDKTRKVLEISEVIGMERGEIITETLFRRDREGILLHAADLTHTEKWERTFVKNRTSGKDSDRA